jgi:addiction module HigA family antidote
MRMKNPAHPGLLVKDHLDDLELSVAAAAAGLGVTRQRLSRLTKAQSAITADMALRLEAALGGEADFWLLMQAAYDLARFRKRNVAAGIERFTQQKVASLCKTSTIDLHSVGCRWISPYARLGSSRRITCRLSGRGAKGPPSGETNGCKRSANVGRSRIETTFTEAWGRDTSAGETFLVKLTESRLHRSDHPPGAICKRWAPPCFGSSDKVL